MRLSVACALVLVTSHALPAQRAAVADSAKAADANTRGLAYLSQARYDSALVDLRLALVIRRALDDSAGLGRTLNSIGAAHYQMGQYDVALDAFLEALALRRAEGDQQGVARVLVNIGKIYHDWRQVDEAAQVLQEARAVADSAGHPFVLGYALNALGDLQAEVGEFSAARESFMGSLRAYSSYDPRMAATDSATGWWLNTGSLARLLIREGRPAEALPLLEALADAARRITSLRAEARAYLYLAEAHHALGDRRAAIGAAEHSLGLSRQLSQRVFALAALSQLAELERESGNAAVALGHLRAFNALRDTIFDQSTAQRIASLRARIETERLRSERRAQEGLIARQRVVVALAAAVLALAAALLVVLYRFNLRLRERQRELAAANAGLEVANAELRTALSEVRTLKGFIPICARCKRIRDDKGFWEAVETYVSARSEAMFSHSICTKCGPELYGEEWHASQALESVRESEPASGDAGLSSPSSSSS